jgi:hypothetical protein
MEAANLTHHSHKNELQRPNPTGAFFRPVIQAKFSVNEPGDHFEQEADAMADKVMRMAAPPINQNTFFKPSDNTLQRKCQHCEEEEKHVHRKEENRNDVRGSNELDSYASSLNSSGHPMPESSRNFFEPRFGHDFSNVRLHTDSVAAKSAQSINALAYTTGNNIVFNSGQFSPESDGGKKLMAHELTHVIQQQSAGNAKIQRMIPCPASLADDAPVPTGWRLYPGPTSVFHCGFRTILEDRAPTPDDPMNECVYDHSGVLVTDSHPFAGCKGTPDQYSSSAGALSAVAHATIDSGGIARAGFPAFVTSRVHDLSDAIAAGIGALNAVDTTLKGISNAIGNAMLQGILTARAICDPGNWTYNGMPSRTRAHLNVIGAIISSISMSGSINNLLVNLTRPLNTFPIPQLLTEMSADINSALQASGQPASISAAGIGNLSLYQFVEWLKQQGLISYNRPAEQVAAEDMQRLLSPPPQP